MYLLWYDDTKKKPTEDKILEGVQRYVERFGQTPNVCLVNPSEVILSNGITVRPASYVRPNHYWIGVETETTTRTRAARKKAA